MNLELLPPSRVTISFSHLVQRLLDVRRGNPPTRLAACSLPPNTPGLSLSHACGG